jgi:hypothetical protein
MHHADARADGVSVSANGRRRGHRDREGCHGQGAGREADGGEAMTRRKGEMRYLPVPVKGEA